MSVDKSTKRPRVRIARPDGRPYQVRYTDPATGKEVRLSVGSRSEADAERLKAQTEAKLLLGVPASKKRTSGPAMAWGDFREEYSRLKLATLRPNGAKSAEHRLDICERLVKVRTLADMAQPETLSRLKAELLIGRSPHSVNSYLMSLVAAINWAYADMGWLPARVSKATVECDDPDKGRPITSEEFERMLAATEHVCRYGADAWRYLLRGLWESGLRVSEVVAVSWDIPGTIQPVFPRRGRPVLLIPGGRQKNRKRQEVAILDSFVALLDEHETRTGYVFHPVKRNGRKGRPAHQQVARTIAAIGKWAGVVVNDKGKTATAHDLRRSFGQRLADAGVHPRDLQKIMRHASFSTTEAYYLRDDVQDTGDRINAKLGTPPKTVPTFDIETAMSDANASAKPLQNTGK